MAKLDRHLFRDSLRDRHGCDTSGLGATDLKPSSGKAHLNEVLWHLRGLTATSFSDDNKDTVVEDGLLELLFEIKDGQAFLLSLDCG